MGIKVLGRHDAAAGVAANLVVGSANGETFNVWVTNNNAGNAAIKMSISNTTATIEADGYVIADDFVLASGQTIKRTGFALETGFFFVVESDVVSVNFVALGVQA